MLTSESSQKDGQGGRGKQTLSATQSACITIAQDGLTHFDAKLKDLVSSKTYDFFGL
jgi:hypothetical protein